MAAFDSARTRPTGPSARPALVPSTGPARPRVKARELVPCYRAGAGPTSFRHGLPDHERGVIDAALGILGRYLGEPGAAIQSPAEVRQFLRLHLGAEKHEVFAVLYLDNQHRAIAFETPFNGTLTQTSVYPREIARAALGHNAAAVLLAHNHPSGAARPSRADEVMTQAIKDALQVLDVRVLDHFIVTNQEAVSMVEMGLM
jgi:DNA repair protein RadC